jgi:subtilisin family serine protease
MLRLLPLLALLLARPAAAQSPPPLRKYWVEFTDKQNSPWCSCRPAEFLSARALERRAKAGIPVVENDLPVSPAYVKALTYNGLKIHGTSRWLNGAAVIADSATMAALPALPFVRKTEYLGPHIKFRNPPNRRPKKRRPLAELPRTEGGPQSPWGYAALQNSLLGVPLLHLAGHRGRGMWVAVMDGGFTNTDTLPFFDSLALQQRLFQGWDFVERDQAVFEGAQHGTSVLSVMGANLPGYFVGTAPDASYFLLKTEDTAGEYPIEEFNWVAGAEWADSIGVDIVNASLGYTVFNDTRLGHRYAELDGRTALASRGAAIAATKGMIVLNSAGNEGNDPWRHIGVPADAPGLIAVGAVRHDERRAEFSAFGPSADGRIKPDLMAPGKEVITAGNFDIQLGVSDGTSLAAPMLAGAMAALWSAYPEKTAAELLDAVFESADQHAQPDNARGYGLPDMTRAWLRLGNFSRGNFSLFAFDRAAGQLQLLLPNDGAEASPESGAYALYNALGQGVQGLRGTLRQAEFPTLVLSGLENAPPGSYFVQIRTDGGTRYIPVALWR